MEGNLFMYIEYRAGDNTDPWRTPVFGWKGLDSAPDKVTVIDTLSNSCLSIDKRGGELVGVI